MKKLYTLMVMGLFSLSLMAQGERCATNEMLDLYHEQNPEMLQVFQEQILDKNKAITAVRKSGNKLIIPVVVHVIHYNGLGNISKAQILDGMRIVNEDFNKLNADTNTIRSVFQNLSVSSDIEFRLAKRDPNGNCTDGITRTNSYLAMGPPNRNQPKSLIQWDPFRYMNVWIVNSFNSPNLLGFAQFPGNGGGPLSTYGLVVRANEWGSIGTAASSFGFGRTPTHEFGHCLELFHPFQSGCGSLCQGTGDLVCDTPPQASSNNNDCFPPVYNTCPNDASGGNALNPNPFNSNVPDQLENFMGYGDGCSVMFTQGQKDRIDRAIANYSVLQSLVDTNNAIFTGTNDGYVAPDCAPIAEILTFDRFTCTGGSVQFSENSYGGPITTYNWSFPGGSPATSSSATPLITYNTPGDYDVTLIVSNSTGADTIVMEDYVHVSATQATYSGFNYNESFENATTFANDWIVVSPSGGPTFDRAAFAGKTGTASVWLNNLNNVYEGGIDQLISPTIKMSDVLNPSISMEVSYRRRTSSSNDQLVLKASINCGANWFTILSTGPLFYAFDNSTQTSNFFPTQGSQWQNVTIPSNFIPASIRTADNAMFMIEIVHGDGNNFYIDDFQIVGQPVGVEEVKQAEADFVVYPNPAKDRINMTYKPTQAVDQASIYLTNVLGEKIVNVYNGSLSNKEYQFVIESSDLAKGIYFLTIDSDSERQTKKVIIH